MLQRLILPQRDHLGGRFESLRNGIVVDGLGPSAGRGCLIKGDVAHGDGDQVAQLTVLHATALVSTVIARSIEARTEGSSHGRSRRPKLLAVREGEVGLDAIHPARAAPVHVAAHSV